DHCVFHEIPDGERAHYSSRTIDIEYQYPFGTKELYGLANRTDYDLKRHAETSKQEFTYFDQETKERFVPHVIEPTFGVDRTMLVVLLEAYHEIEGGRTTTTESAKEVEVVLKLPKELAPIKVAVLPLSKKAPLTEKARAIATALRKRWMVAYDDVASIGRRYRRQDEIGTPYCVTIDFESLEDGKVTVRDRDTMQQERVAIGELPEYMRTRLEE
ncbi:MAG: His/Gly/Thr/Pro-type tRNA ligase C-terminal domain-containing protein, partial [bacterium]|nr:His/Gly/Thr/Pro-type tRNA ligase C-terminal domain-containing protein [bacterium]